MRDRATYDRVSEDLHTSIMGGIRLYYPMPHYFTQEQLGKRCCTVFKMKQLVTWDLLSDLRFAEGGDHRQVKLSNYADRIKNDIASYTWKNRARPLSQSITYQWPASHFEEWLEDAVDEYWMTAEWFQKDYNDGSIDSDYAFMVSVHAVINCTQEEWDEQYGSAFIMTKMLYQT